jgi:rhamnosyltransferase
MYHKIAVLLAAYNGQEWIEEQINSIINQKNVAVTIYVSIDLSCDNTYAIVQKLSQKYKNIKILPYGDRFGGAAPNFFRLIRDVDFSAYDYFSLTDQDDIWNLDKLDNACKALSTKNYDAYSSNVVAFWDGGNSKIINKSQAACEFDYLFESAGPGCTFVFSKKLALNIQKELINIGERSRDILLHDWFVYSFSRTNGYKWFIDDIPSMDYRQHSENQVGANVGFKSIYIRAKLVLGGEGFKKVISQAKILKQVNLKPIQLLLNNNRFSFFRLAFYSFKCRRKLLDKIFFLILCIVMVLKGPVKHD